MANRLGSATSPYLRQHADNPVHWQEWGPDAMAEAHERDVPILLSVGYAACHWCHVMAHESFEDDDTAALMNANFVCIKVDREERPDIDAIYMNATVAMTGQGGWPMTCFLTADGAPFYCGTYYPRQPRGGMPSFTQLLTAITDTWNTRRDEIDRVAAAVVDDLGRASGAVPAGEAPPSIDDLNAAVTAVLHDEDPAHGGFGGAPKFPPSALLEGLLRSVERTGSTDVLDVITRAADAMARGGIYDQVGGGFARYSVDAQWIVPHFEKMLYDNAQLLRFYAHLARRTDSPLARRIAIETATFMLETLRTAEGGFASALDADTEGVEGLTYAWTPDQLIEILGFEDGVWAAGLFAVSSTGTFEAGMSVLQLPEDPDDLQRWDAVRAKLLDARNRRPQPERDDKVITAWNGLAITALAEAGAALGQPEWVEAAVHTADMLLRTHLVDGRLRRASLGGTVGEPAGILEDYAALATGLAALHQATGDAGWIAKGAQLVDTALTHFADASEPGSWFDTADDAETLVTRPRDPVDGATPSGASTITEALLTLTPLVDPETSARYAIAAEQSLARASVLVSRASRSAGHWIAVAEAYVAGPLQIAVALNADVPEHSELLQAARAYAPGGAVVVGGVGESSPLLPDRPPVDGKDAAYICRGTVCGLPVTDPDELRQALARQP
ncbi:MAG: thioredoxin domain-containing protein [Rhodococcus sp.]|nr:thioredoxin domain-containing protein [Rhodococcus sp. (in: high G+C Gram-positive bacteria)]